jgi:hypothetical protein
MASNFTEFDIESVLDILERLDSGWVGSCRYNSVRSKALSQKSVD